MDSILTDTSNFKQKLNDFLESSLNALDMRSAWIHKELDKLREDYTGIIEKVNEYVDNPALFKREKSPGSTTSPSTKFINATNYDQSKHNSNNTLPILQRCKTPGKNVYESPSNASKKSSIDLNKSTNSINEKNSSTKNAYILQYLMSKDKSTTKPVKEMRNNNKKETSKSSFDFKHNIKKELDKRLQFTANKYISNPNEIRKELSPTKTRSESPIDFKQKLSPNKSRFQNPIDLKKELAPRIDYNGGKKDSTKSNKSTEIKVIPTIPDHRKFSILDIPAFYPNRIELKGKNKAYFLLANSDVVPIRTRFVFSRVNKDVASFFGHNDVLKDYSLLLENNIDRIEEQLQIYSNNDLVHSKFKPSKTAQNSLNFITSKDEKELIELEINDEIYDMVQFIYVLIGYNVEDRNNSMKRLYNEIIPKLGVTNMKTLFLKKIVNNLYFNTKCIESINSICMNKNIFNSSDIIKFNKAFSCITFILKEIYDYINVKIDDYTYLMDVRNMIRELELFRHKSNLVKVKI